MTDGRLQCHHHQKLTLFIVLVKITPLVKDPCILETGALERSVDSPTDSSVHPVEITIPKDLVSTYNTVALVVDIGSSPKFFSLQTE
jgi:hypothetical protein